MDPRPSVVEERLENINRVLAVASSKGGVGKSTLASLLALNLSHMGEQVGLLDLDFHGPSDHLILGLEEEFPEEEDGVTPPEIHGIRFMSVVYYTRGGAMPLRGTELSDALLEILTITLWGSLDTLVVDLPPGLGETLLNTMNYLKQAEYLPVTTPSLLSTESVKNLITLLQETRLHTPGYLVNKPSPTETGEKQINYDIPCLGVVEHDPLLENAIGHPRELLNTQASKNIRKIITQNLKQFKKKP